MWEVGRIDVPYVTAKAIGCVGGYCSTTSNGQELRSFMSVSDHFQPQSTVDLREI